MNITVIQKSHLNEIHALIRDSITLLCTIDHGNDQENLDFWLANRSPESLAKVIDASDSKGFVCMDETSIVGVAHIKRTGELTLCYVHPEHPGKGIGSRLLTMIEGQARHWGIKEITLISTATAKPFYEKHEYFEYDEPVTYLRMPGYLMKKVLSL
ncbi:MAG: GNAT family N-acetyltransferase [Pyrinomonadaceae bacterium]|nr:GNAT family N-acetyltransferase [Pyrinomonadaceae bacterium]